MMSVCLRSPRRNRRPMPRGLALGSVSGMLGIPVELEKRTQMGVVGLLKWGAVESFAASGEAVKVPPTIMPLACAVKFCVSRPLRTS